MLPFLPKPKSIGGSITLKREPDNKDSGSIDPVEPYASDLIDAIQANDVQKAAQALRDAFNCLELMPHDEAPHDNSEES